MPRTITANDLSESDFLTWYGRWESPEPTQVAGMLAGSGVRWWIAGGRAVDAASGTTREHDDTDVAIAADDLPALREHLSHLCLWQPRLGTLTPLFPGTEPGEGHEQLWARADADSPWLLDILLTPVEGDEWLFKRDHAIRLPLSRAVRPVDGVPYLAPEVVLLHKARTIRPKDIRDFEVTVDHLDAEARRWLRDALDRHLPDHPWTSRLM